MEEKRETTAAEEPKLQDKGLSQIKPNEKRGWWSIAFIWVGTMICIPMLMVGGIFGGALTMSSIFWATLIGFAVCCVLMILGGIVGSDTGLNSTMCSTHAFGMTGANFTMALVIFICEVGWFGVQTATCALAFNTLMLQLLFVFHNIPLRFISLFLGCAIRFARSSYTFAPIAVCYCRHIH